jgi:hypothetical protein
MSGDHNMYADQEKKVDRFDLEQEIMKAWHVVDDLEMIKKFAPKECEDNIEAVRALSDLRFRQLFDVFETLIQERKL